LHSDLTRKHFRKQRWNGISEQTLRLTPTAAEAYVIRDCLEPT